MGSCRRVQEIKREGAIDSRLAQDICLHSVVDVSEWLARGDGATP